MRRRRIAALISLLALAGGFSAHANPVPERSIRAFEDAVHRWVVQPDSTSKLEIVGFLGSYGVSRHLISAPTIDFMASHFASFAPLLIAAQTPPRPPQGSLQSWFRERATADQADRMKAVLREWLVVPMTETPWTSFRIMGPPEAVQHVIFETRVSAAEQLADWRDTQALPAIRALQEKAPKDLVLAAAIRALTNPDHGRVLQALADGRIELHRTDRDIDSLVVSCYDALKNEPRTWNPNRGSIRKIWKSLGETLVYGTRRVPYPERASFDVRKVRIRFYDGASGTFEHVNANEWQWTDDGHPRDWIFLERDPLNRVLETELKTAKVSPEFPRFVEESVTLFLHPNEMEVEGRYKFEGVPDDGLVSLRYPIAGDGMGLPKIDRIQLHAEDKRDLLPVDYVEDELGAKLVLKPGGAYRYDLEIRYHQPLVGHSATYLVTTAKEWGRPLEQGTFQVIADTSLGDPHFEWPFQALERNGSTRRYLYQARPFSPDRDLVVTW